MNSKLSCTSVTLFIFLILLCGLSPGAAEVIIDNGDLGTSFTGTWSVSAGTGAYGVDSLWGRGGATYTWQTAALDAGYYEVFMWWTQYTSRTDAAPVAIVHSAGTANITVNQQINGSMWNSLGTFYFDGTGSVTITGIGVFPTNTCADAVRFTQTAAPPPAIIIDNTDAATSRVGTWQVSGAPDPYGVDSLWSRTVNNSFTWNFNCTERGYYNVSMWWTYITSRSTAAPVQIQTAAGVQSLTVNQQLNGGTWNLLGEYFFEVGTYSITIRTLADNSSVCADAVGFTKTSTPPPGGTIIYNDGLTHEINTLVLSDYEVYDGPASQPTTLNITATGEVGTFDPPTFNGVSVRDHSILNIYGLLNWGFGASGYGQVNMYSGWSHGFGITGNSRVDMYGGSVSTSSDPFGINWATLNQQAQVYLHNGSISGNVVANGSSRLTVDGGNIGNSDEGILIEAHDLAQIEINGGTGTSGLLECYDTSEAAINGGAIANVGAYGTGVVTISGGSVQNLTVGGYADIVSTVQIYGSAFNLPFGEVAATSGTITGTLEKGGTLNLAFTRASNSKIILIESSADDFIIDNGDAGTSFTGTWNISAGTGAWDENSLWGRGGATYTWQTSLPAGFYEVFMWWTQYTSRTDAAPVAIVHSGGTENLTVNQQINGSQWNSLGTFYFDGTGSVTITGIGVFPTNTCADAVRFTRSTAPPPSGIIIDNSDANTSRVGTWLVSGGTGAYGTDSLYCRTANASFSWLFTPAEDGYYNVLMWWTEFSSRSAAAPVEIQDSDGVHALTVNQQTNGAQWNLLGEYLFYAGTTYRVTIRTLTDSSSVCADAVCFSKTDKPVPPPPSLGVIIDNTDANTEIVGTWPVSGAPDPYGTNSVYCRTAGASFSWIFTPTKTAYYDVMMWWTFISSRSTAAPVEIQNADGTASLTVNQQLNAGMWNALGTYPFTAGTAYRVTIRTLTDNSSVCADAVRFVEGTPPPPAGIIIDNRDTNVEMVGTWAVSAGLNPWGTDSVWCRTANSSFTWLFTPPEDAYYNVFMWWTDSTSRSTAAPVEIQNVDGTEYLTVNQMANYAMWNLLGEYPFYGGVTYKIIIRTLADNSSVCADAVMFEKTDTPPPPPPPPPTGTIIDNNDTNTSRVGTWPVSGGVNPWGTDSLYCRTADSSFSWIFTPEKTAYYEVFMWWTEYSSRSAVTPVEIQNVRGTWMLTVNQQTNGGKWNSLGKFSFEAGTAYNVTVRTLADMSAVCADAVRFVETTPPGDVIIDNRDASTSSVGTWLVSGGLNPYGVDSVYCRTAGSSFTWQFTPTISGTYNVLMWWTEFSSRSTVTPVEIQHSGGTASMTVNQQTNGGMWNLLGNYQFEAGTTYNITVRTLADSSAICADAVRLTMYAD